MDDRKIEELLRKIEEVNRPTPELPERLLSALRREGGRAWAKPRPFKLVLRVAVCALLLALASITALAAALPGFRAWLFGPESGMGEALRETAAVSEAQGFRVEVLGTATDQGSVVIYYTLEDVGGRNRLSIDTAVDSSAQLTNAYGFCTDTSNPSIARAHTENISYDPSTQTLLCRLNLLMHQDWLTGNADSLFGYEAGSVTAQVRVLSIRVQNQREYHILPLSQCPLTTETLPIGLIQNNTAYREDDGRFTFGPDEFIPPAEYEPLFARSFDQDLFAHFRDESGAPSILRPSDDLPWDWLCAVGFLADELHVQTVPWLPYQSGGTHAGVGWVDCVEAGREQEAIRQHQEQASRAWNTGLGYDQRSGRFLISSLFRVEDSQAVLCTNYNDSENLRETCFDLTPQEAAGYSLVFLHLDTEDLYPGLLTEPFLLGDQQLGEAQAFLDLDFDGIAVERMRVSPLGAILVGEKGQLEQIRSLELVSGGKTCPCSLATDPNRYRSREPDYVISASYFVDGVPVDMEALEAVRINGREFPLKKE